MEDKQLDQVEETKKDEKESKEEIVKELQGKVDKIENPTKLSIYEKLNRIQVELKAPKNQYNKFGKFKYRSLEDVYEGLKPLIDKYGVIVLIEDEIAVVGERYYIKATATLVDMISKEKISTTAFAREPLKKDKMDESQSTGSASSYARKYAMNALFAIDDNKDADTDEYQEQTKANNNQNKKQNYNKQNYNKQNYNKQNYNNKQMNNQANNKTNLEELRQRLANLAKMKNQVAVMPEIIRTKYNKTSSAYLTEQEMNELIQYLSGL